MDRISIEKARHIASQAVRSEWPEPAKYQRSVLPRGVRLQLVAGVQIYSVRIDLLFERRNWLGNVTQNSYSYRIKAVVHVDATSGEIVGLSEAGVHGAQAEVAASADPAPTVVAAQPATCPQCGARSTVKVWSNGDMEGECRACGNRW